MLDPFSDVAQIQHLEQAETDEIAQRVWDLLDPDGHFDLDLMRDALSKVPPTAERTPGSGERASLERMGFTHMPTSMLKRFVRKVRVAQLDWVTPCWLWTGGTHDRGYGRFHLGFIDGVRVTAYAHRIAFEHWVGPLPPGYIGDHQCNHKLCCNPTHIWPETNTENLRLADQRRPWKRRNQYSKE